MLPSRFCLNGIIFFFFRFSWFCLFLLFVVVVVVFQVCEQLLKGITYPLAVKSTQVLDLAHQKECFLV